MLSYDLIGSNVMHVELISELCSHHWEAAVMCSNQDAPPTHTHIYIGRHPYC